MPLHDGITHLTTWIAREEKRVLPSLSCIGLCLQVISGDPTGTSATHLNVFSRGRNKTFVTAQLHRTGGKHNTFVKEERIFLKTQSHSNDLHS